ncbi:MAG: hypothetical protein ACRBDL_00120 [Alphaproteobacteria bacterium]
MIRIEKIDDYYADVHATQEEWNALRAIIEKASTRYHEEDLYLDVTEEELSNLAVEISTHHDIPAPLEREHLRHFLQVIARTDGMIVAGLSTENHYNLVDQLSSYNTLDIFKNTDVNNDMEQPACG